ncbi:PREDICTED: putative clathrin assembly protein At5g10410 [Tarenaya hassleriana]|uniref:putative clathrin assembly protein At5g10410 n=1 Tax=Tarenaya hassleriana TaxID=28532 RepID=UPI00053C6D61|nr:PREDICTED: putative clathrin assembly protein At5g10410 [Tarenaya hassleriana]
MTKLKRLLGKFKDRASEGKAVAVHAFRPNTKSLHLALLKSTNHNYDNPPDDDYVAAVVSYSGSRRYGQSLIVLHKLIKPEHGFNGEIYIQGHHLFFTEGRNNLKLNNFRDESSHLTLELSPWIRWYAKYLDCLSSTCRVLGFFPSITAYSKDKAVEKHRVSCYKTGHIIEQTGYLVSFFEHIRQRPENPALYRNKIVDEIRELVAQDYFSVMRWVMVRLEVLNERLSKPGVGFSESDALGPVLVRLEKSTGTLTEFPWRYRVLVEDFWGVVRGLKGNAIRGK